MIMRWYSDILSMSYKMNRPTGTGTGVDWALVDVGGTAWAL